MVLCHRAKRREGGGGGGGEFFLILEVRGQETKGDTFLGGLTPLDTILSTGISF